jgi:hypothetical protein
METAIQQLQTAIKKITHQYSAYGDDAATLLAAFFDGSTLGRSLFHQINKKMQLTAKNVELHDFTKHWCSPIQAVCLIVALGLSRAKYRHLLSFASAKQQAYFNATGVRVPNLFPGRRTVEDTWKSLTSLCTLESPTWYNNTVSISWPLEEWLEYVQSQDAIWDTVADPQDGITLIIRGDGYPVAGCSWTQLNVSIMDHGRHARTTSHMWVISLAYASDKDMEDLKILWKTNVEVCCAAFFVMFHRKMNFSS